MFTLLKLLFVCFTPLVNYLPIYNQVNTNDEIVEVKHHNDLARTSGYVAVSPVELLSTVEFFTNFNTSQLYNLTSNDTYYLPYLPSYTKAVYYNQIGHSYTEGTDFGYNLGSDFVEAYFTFLNEGTNENALNKNYYFRITLSNGNYLRYGFTLSFFVDSRTSEYEDGQLFSSIVSSMGLFYSNGTNVPTNPSYYLVGLSYSWLYNAKGIGTSNYSEGYNYGYDIGFEEGYNNGYDEGVERGKEIAEDPASEIYETTYNIGYQSGYTAGLTDGSASGGVPSLIFSGILNVALLPVDIFLQMFQYEVFGINIAGLISGLLTVAMVITVLRFVMGGKSKDD